MNAHSHITIGAQVAALKQERDEAVAHNAVMRDALIKAEYAIKGREHTGFIATALTIPPSAALREIEARSAVNAMERLKRVFTEYESDELFISTVIDHIEIELAAAKRKGE